MKRRNKKQNKRNIKKNRKRLSNKVNQHSSLSSSTLPSMGIDYTDTNDDGESFRVIDFQKTDKEIENYLTTFKSLDELSDDEKWVYTQLYDNLKRNEDKVDTSNPNELFDFYDFFIDKLQLLKESVFDNNQFRLNDIQSSKLKYFTIYRLFTNRLLELSHSFKELWSVYFFENIVFTNDYMDMTNEYNEDDMYIYNSLTNQFITETL